MDTHRSVNVSRWIYARLLGLYPSGHRAEYGADMLQLFTDQCREAASAKRPLGLLALWLRTLADLGVSALREHITAPHSWQGLLEAIPNAPLPWSGVALVLLPGLIFFIAQVGQLTGEDWFFLLSYRAGYFMIIPVLIVWLWKRKFPIWGLIPLGLFFRTALAFGFRVTLRFLENSNPFNVWWLKLVRQDAAAVYARVAACAVIVLTILALLWLIKRRDGMPGRAWAGLGAYLALVAALAYRAAQSFLEWMLTVPKEELAQSIKLGYINPTSDVFDSVYYAIYDHLGLLLLILLGALLARRHGRLATLLPLGYLLPSLIYGRISDNWPAAGEPEFTFMLAVSAAALAYRFLVALAGPLWIVRSASGEQQKSASAISLLTLVGIQVAFNLVLLLTSMRGYSLFDSAAWMMVRQMVLAAAIFLALNLYRPAPRIETPMVMQGEEAAAEG